MNKRFPQKCLLETHPLNPQCQHFALQKDNINGEAVTKCAKPAPARQEERRTPLCYGGCNDFRWFNGGGRRAWLALLLRCQYWPTAICTHRKCYRFVLRSCKICNISTWVNKQAFSASATQHSWEDGCSGSKQMFHFGLCLSLYPNFLQSHLATKPDLCTHKEAPSLCIERLKRNSSQDRSQRSHPGLGCDETPLPERQHR